MHNRYHTCTPPTLPPSPSVGEMKKWTHYESGDRKLQARLILQRVKVTTLIVISALVTLTLFGRPLSTGSGASIENVSPFVTQAQDDIKCKPRSFNSSNTSHSYSPSSIEKYIIDNTKSLGYETIGTDLADTCALQKNDQTTIYDSLQQYFSDLEQYNKLVQDFKPLNDLRLEFNSDGDKQSACETTKLHSDGLSGIFKSGQLSTSSDVGAMEPLLSTMRSHKICDNFDENMLAMDYMVHDFYSMCQQLQKHSRLIFIDMGASLDFHDDINGKMPAIYIHSIYSKFGFKFDHIYAYEVNPKHPAKVFEALPDELQSSWHWINVGVDARECAKMNPFTMIANSFTPDDFIVVKLDIDTPAVEHVLVEQLKNDPSLIILVDQFYFEHHVHQKELASSWTGTMEGSVGGSLKLMAELRKNGVAAHYWP